jgi:hypothetical protein
VQKGCGVHIGYGDLNGRGDQVLVVEQFGGGPRERVLVSSVGVTVQRAIQASSTAAAMVEKCADNRWFGAPIGPSDHVEVPTAVAMFANHFVESTRAITTGLALLRAVV